jgi:hypothetical protein
MCDEESFESAHDPEVAALAHLECAASRREGRALFTSSAALLEGITSMAPFTLERSLSARWLVVLPVLLVLGSSGCSKSKRPAGPPKEPKLRIEGPAGTRFGYSVSYFDGPGDLEVSGTVKTIPDSGVFTEDLKGGHKGLLIQVTPNSSAKLTVVLLDGSTEIQRATATGENETAEVKAGTVRAVGPFGK